MSSDSEEKYDENDGIDDNDSIIFGGQVPRAPTQVTGLTNIEKSKTLMTLSTAKVQTKPVGHNKPSPYVPDSDLFQFSNPNRPPDDIEIAQNQTYNNGSSAAAISSQPTFSRPTAARQHGNAIQQKYAQHLTFKGDADKQILFGRFTNKSSCCLLICSTILSLLFCYVAIVFFPKFGEEECNKTCIHSEIPEEVVDGIISNSITLISACNKNFLMFSFNANSNLSTSSPNAYTFDGLKDNIEATDIESMYIGGTDLSVNIFGCWGEINNDNTNSMDGYIEIDYDEYSWEWSASGWYLIASLIMALFFILIEWLFYSYNEIMIPRKDYRAYIMWYLIRIGWMSFMFAIIIAHSLLIVDNIIFMVGSFDYIWVKADCFIATGFIGLFILICLCCCCFQESDGFSGGNPFSSPDDFGFEKYFLPQSRMDLLVINDFEQGLGTAMCTTMIFVIGFIICGFVPFIEFLQAGLSGYTYFPYIVSLWFLSIIAMTFQMCWFVRARCCGDADDKREAQMHDEHIQRVGTLPAVR